MKIPKEAIEFVEKRLKEYEDQQKKDLCNIQSLHRLGENRGRVLATLDILSFLQNNNNEKENN